MLAIFLVGIMEESTIVTLMLFRGFRDRYWKFKFKGIRTRDDWIRAQTQRFYELALHLPLGGSQRWLLNQRYVSTNLVNEQEAKYRFLKYKLWKFEPGTLKFELW